MTEINTTEINTTEINIIEFIKKNPINKLSEENNNKLLNKIKENFTSNEEKIFIKNFYSYLNYDNSLDFVINLNNIWKLIGFSSKQKSQNLLEKNFKLDIDYKNCGSILTNKNLNNENSDIIENNKKHGGHNKIIILLTLKCFKSLCMKVQRGNTIEIYEYYIKLEKMLQEIIDEDEIDTLILEIQETKEQEKKILLEKIEEEKKNLLKNSLKEKQKAVEKSIINQFPINTECIYIGTIDNTNKFNEKLIKFGHSNNLQLRISNHRKDYNNFVLIEAFRVQNKVEIENLIKNHEKIRKQIRTIEADGKNKTEIICYDDVDFTIDKLSKYIKDIINNKTYSIDNFNKLLKQNEDLENELRIVKEINKNQEKIIFEKELYINELTEKIEKNEKIITSVNNENESVYKNILLPEDELHKKFDEFIKTVCVVHPDVQEISTNLEGRFRIWHGVKPKKEVFHALKNYLDVRFKQKKIDNQHGYIGIRLNPVEYKKTKTNCDAENFIFHACKFSDNFKVLNSVLLAEYQKWKISIEKELSDNDMKELKEYLNESHYVLKATVWVDQDSNEGYYGLCLKHNEYKTKYTSSSGKKVYRREVDTNILLGTWDTIVSASEFEGISKASMSRGVKNKTVIENYYYSDS